MKYPIIRFYLRVGLTFKSIQDYLPVCKKKEDRKPVEDQLTRLLKLEEGVEDQLILRWKYRWDHRGRLKTIRLYPHPKVRRTPGIPMVKDLFFDQVEKNKTDE